MSAISDIKAAVLSAITAGVPPSVKVVSAVSGDDFSALARMLPSIGLVYAGRTWEAPKVQGQSTQASTWRWDVYVFGRAPAPNVPAGTDLFSLLEYVEAALAGLSVSGIHGTRFVRVDETVEDVLPTAQVIVQTWESWRSPMTPTPYGSTP